MAIALFGQVAAAAPPPAVFVQVSGWMVYRHDRQCSMLLLKREDNVGPLQVFYDDRNKLATLVFSDPGARRIGKSDRRELTIILLRRNGKKADDGWGKRAFIVAPTGDGQDGASFSTTLDEEFLTDLAHNSRIEFRDGDARLQGFGVWGAGEAIAAVRRCARALVPKRERTW